jgi:hypothetical protein
MSFSLFQPPRRLLTQVKGRMAALMQLNARAGAAA